MYYFMSVSITVNFHEKRVDFVLDELGDMNLRRERHYLLGDILLQTRDWKQVPGNTPLPAQPHLRLCAEPSLPHSSPPVGLASMPICSPSSTATNAQHQWWPPRRIRSEAMS